MKTLRALLLIVAASVLPALAQNIPAQRVLYVTADPAGVCSVAAALRYNTSNGALWGCDAGTWTQVGGGGSMTWPTTPGVAVCTGTPCTAWGTSLTAPTGALVGTTDTQTLTGKTVDGVSPTVFAFLDPTSSVQTQLNAKAASNAATTVNGQTCTLGSSCTIPLSAINPQTATYQVLAGDFSNYKTITAASGTFTVTLVASGTQPANGQYITVINYGSGVVTIARSGQNINGSTGSLTLAAGSATAPTSAKIYSDGTNYFATTAGATGGAGGTTWNAPVSLASIPACSTTAFFQPFTDAVFSYAYCDGASTYTYYITGQQVTPIVTGNWTTLGSGGTRTNGTKAVNIVGTTGGSGNVYGVSATVAGGDFTHIIVVLPSLSASTSNSNVQIGFTDGTKAEGCGPYWIASSGTGAWSSVVTDGKTTALVGGTYSTANGDGGLLLTMNQGFPLFFKLTRVGTALACAYSNDGGLNYTTFFTDSVPFMTATSVAVWADPRGAAGAPRFTLVAYQ